MGAMVSPNVRATRALPGSSRSRGQRRGTRDPRDSSQIAMSMVSYLGNDAVVRCCVDSKRPALTTLLRVSGRTVV